MRGQHEAASAAKETSMNPAVVRMLIGMDGIRTCFCFTLDWLSQELRKVRCVTHVWCQPARHQKAGKWCYLPQLAAKIQLTPTRQKVCPNHIPFIITSLTFPNISKNTCYWVDK